MHINTPRFQLAHRGSGGILVCVRLHTCQGGIRLFLLQSEHVLFPSSFTRFLSVARFCSARSAAGLGRRDIVEVKVLVVGGVESECIELPLVSFQR